MKLLPAPLRRYWWEVHGRFHDIYQAHYSFIHINKTGGSSVERALNLRINHRTAREVRDVIGKRRWASRFTFTVVRNPWDKVVSHYHFRHARDKSNIQTDDIGFADWVRLSYGEKDPRYYHSPRMYMPQLAWITDERGEILVDFVARFETLQRDFRTVCDRIGVSATLPHLKKSDRGHYRDYYAAETKRIIADCFREDIEYFGYEF